MARSRLSFSYYVRLNRARVQAIQRLKCSAAVLVPDNGQCMYNSLYHNWVTDSGVYIHKE